MTSPWPLDSRLTWRRVSATSCDPDPPWKRHTTAPEQAPSAALPTACPATDHCSQKAHDCPDWMQSWLSGSWTPHKAPWVKKKKTNEFLWIRISEVIFWRLIVLKGNESCFPCKKSDVVWDVVYLWIQSYSSMWDIRNNHPVAMATGVKSSDNCADI